MTEDEAERRCQGCMDELLEVLNAWQLNGCLYVSQDQLTDAGLTLVGISRLRLNEMTHVGRLAVADQAKRQIAQLGAQVAGRAAKAEAEPAPLSHDNGTSLTMH